MKRRIFYGYWVLAASFIITVINSGSGVYAFSLFVKPLESSQGWERSQIMAGFFLWSFLAGAAAPVVGRIIDRWGTRRVFALGGGLTGVAFILLSQGSEAWQFIAGWSLIGITMAASGHVPASAVVSNWFFRRRGFAIGIMSAGVGVGGMVMAPLIGGAIIPTLGWRAGYITLGVLAWVIIIPLALAVIRTRPSDVGLLADGATRPEMVVTDNTPRTVPGGLTLKQVAGKPAFWLIVISVFAGSTAQGGVFQNQVPFFEDTGFSGAVAASVLSGVAVASAIAKFGFGWLCDRIHAGYAWAIGMAMQAGGTAILLFLHSASPVAMVWAYILVLGLGIGGWLPTMSMVVSTRYGLESYGTIFGAVSFVFGFGQAAGPLIAGRMYDVSGTYHQPFLLFMVLFAVSVITMLTLRPVKKRR